jgi:hypothetical protein
MRKSLAVVVVFLFLGSVLPADQGNLEAKILKFDTMFGVTAPFLRNQGNPIRGVDGGGVPWQLKQITGDLKANGDLRIEVHGLVIVSTGVNPSPVFRAVVSCISIDAQGNVVDPHNVITDAFPATPEGNAEIRANVELPRPCIAPIIFVTNAGGNWFAATGF